VSYDSCTSRISCSYGDPTTEGRCFIEYGDDSSLLNISLDLNSATEVLPSLKTGTVYNYNATITMAMEIAKVKGSLNPIECEECSK